MESQGSTAADGATEIVWANVPESWGAFVFLAVAAAILYFVYALYRRDRTSCPPLAKALLLALRTAALLLLGAIFLGPALVQVQERKLRPDIVVLRDASQSMNTADKYDEIHAMKLSKTLGLPQDAFQQGGVARAQIVDRLLKSEAKGLLRSVSAKGRLKLFDFAEQTNAVPFTEPTEDAGDPEYTVPALMADGRATDLSAAIRHATSAQSPAAVVVFTDGQPTTTAPPQAAAQEAAARGVPLFFVGLGDTTRKRSAHVVSVYARPTAWQNEPFQIDAVVAWNDLDPGLLRVDLLERPADAGQRTEEQALLVQSRRLNASAVTSGRQTIPFTHTASRPGEFQYEVRITAASEEPPGEQRGLSNVVKVLSREQLRVLLIAGAPTWDYQLVERLLTRDKTLRVSCWLQTLDEGRPQEGSLPIAQLPASREALFEYDVILMFDPNPREFDAAWIELLTQYVGEHAGGLLLMAGPKFTSRFLSGSGTGGIAAMLPVSFGDLAAYEVAGLLSASTQAWPLRVPAESRDHALLRVASDLDQSIRRWESLPGVFWSFPAASAKPTAEVLLEHGTAGGLADDSPARPLMVAGRYGGGQVVFLGFSDTWRWRKAGASAPHFDTFWIQAVRFLAAGRSLAGHRRGTIQTDREHYELGEQIRIRAHLVDASFQPLAANELNARWQVDEEPPKDLRLFPVPNQPGHFEATVTATQTGLYRVQAELPDMIGSSGSVETTFHVELPGAETNQVWLNRPLLQELASVSGGRYFDVEEVNGLADAIPDRTETVVTRAQPQPLWDNGVMLAAFLSLLSAEWLLRKRFHLL